MKTMTKPVSSSTAFRIATFFIYLFLAGSLATYFVPFLSVNLPALGTKKWSVRDIVRTIPKSTFRQESQAASFTPQYDFLDLVKELAPRNAVTKAAVKVSPQFIVGALIPIALALTYLLTILNLFLAPLKKSDALIYTSIVATVSIVYVFAGVYFLSATAQQAFADSLRKVAEGPFALITKNFVQKLTIQPDLGLNLLAIFTLTTFIVSLYRAARARRV